MTQPKKLKAKLKKDADFVPPDGGWGWVIIIATGLCSLAVLPMFQQFGLLFRDKFDRIGFTSSQTATIINVKAALTSFVGLVNGPIFRIFSFRQVSLAGSIVIVLSLVITTFCDTFLTYLIFFAAFHGIGYGITSSANALALNVYWKKRRRIATGLSWTIIGLGPIIWPHTITALFFFFGEAGTILILSGFALHSIPFALLLHPVEWHAKKSSPEKSEEKHLINDQINDISQTKENGFFGSLAKIKNLSVMSSQYLYNENESNNPNFEIVDPNVPMITGTEDTYFGQSIQSKSNNLSTVESEKLSRKNSKKSSMANLFEIRSRTSSTLDINSSKKNVSANVDAINQEHEKYKSKRKYSLSLKAPILENNAENFSRKGLQDIQKEEKLETDAIDPEKSKLLVNKGDKKYPELRKKSLTSLEKDLKYGEQIDNKDNYSNLSLTNQDIYDNRKYSIDNHSNQSYITRHKRKSNNFNYENEVLDQASHKLEQYLKENEQYDIDKLNMPNCNLYNEENKKKEENEEHSENFTFWQKVIMFFDLDLLKDFSFINLMLGLNLIRFTELNFALLTPFILGDFGIGKSDVATFLSILAGCDISVRFCIPFIADKTGFDNNTFFLVGALIMSFGRVILAYFNHSYIVVHIVAVIIGLGKGLMTVFTALVIPTYVPLHKLAGATGLQRVTAGVIFFILGPILGYIKDHTSIAVTLYSLNIFTWLTAVSWVLEKYFAARHQTLSEDPVKV